MFGFRSGNFGCDSRFGNRRNCSGRYQTEVFPLFRCTTQPAVNTSTSLGIDDDVEAPYTMSHSFCLSPEPSGDGRSRTNSALSRCSQISKNSAPAETRSFRSPSPFEYPCEDLEESIDDENFYDKHIFFDFVGMSKPYTVSFTCENEEIMKNGEVCGSSGRKSGLTVNHNNQLGARAIVARRASMKDDRCEIGLKLAKMKRQCTVDSSDRKKNPCEEGLPKLSWRPDRQTFVSSYQTRHKYVRRRTSTEIMENFPSSSGGGQEKKPMPPPLTKADKKKMEKLRRNMKELLEMFTAVEQDDIGKVRSMLHRGDVDVNGENMDDLTLLDIATMLNHNDVAELLLKHGAQENPRLTTPNVRTKKLQSLIESAQTKLAELRLSAKQSHVQSKEVDKQLSFWESRLHMLKKMNNNFANADLPLPPKNVGLEVASANSLLVTLEPPEQTTTTVVTRYKIEWFADMEYKNCEGNILVRDLRRLEVTIPGLQTGSPYFVRVSAGNFKGYGVPALSHPPFAIPSCWREVEKNSSGNSGHLRTITDLYHEIRAMRVSESWEKNLPPSADSGGMRKKKTSLRNLFSASTKFQRNLKKGIYLASILYKEDKVLCTVDDNLPVILVDEITPVTLNTDFNWFMKISCGWEDSRWLQYDVNDVCQSSPSVQFRVKLLEAASHMQAALGVQDIGRLHCPPITDSQGSTILVTVQYVSDAKTVQGLAVKWMPLTKLLRKQRSPPVLSTGISSGNDRQSSCAALDMLLSNLLDYLNFYESTYIPLDRGLYLCYLKLHASMNDISIVVPENLPSVLPFVYMRDNPHVSREEWEWVKLVGESEVPRAPTPAQLAFHWSLVSAARILLNDLELTEESLTYHRLYKLEVIEIHPDVSFILIVPASVDVCSAPSHHLASEEKRGCLTLPVPVFEMAHLCTYQPDFISLYCRLSAFLDFFILILQQMKRQAFSESEAESCNGHLNLLNNYQQKLDDIWKSARWITEVASNARDKLCPCGLPLGVLLSYSIEQMSHGLLPLKGPEDSDKHPNLPPEEGEDISDNGEDNSDVGYHSDQSVEKTAVNSSGSQISQSTGSLRSLQVPLHNPTYDWPDSVGRKSEPIPLQRSNRVYMNLVGNGPEHPSHVPSVEPEIGDEWAFDSLVPGSKLRRSRNSSFLQNSYGRRRYGTTLNLASPKVSYRAHTSSVPVEGGPTTDHVYINCPSSSSQYSEDSDSTTVSISATSTPKRGLPSNSGTVSDTELFTPTVSPGKHRLHRQAVLDFDHQDNFEDLSLIDHLYSVAAQRAASPPRASFSPTSRPETAPPLPLTTAKYPSAIGSERSNISRSSSDHSPAQPGLLRVFAAYSCGLAKGTSVKLQLTPKTTSREVVNLVIQQLNKAVQLKGLSGPLYTEEEYDDFCLVAVIGARERCLRDDFAPLELQNPWAKGRLFIRRRDDLLAALEYGNEAKV